MLTTSPYLHTRRPSPTTVEFTVSTLPPPSLALRLTLAIVNIARLLTSLSVLLLLYAKWTTALTFSSSSNNNNNNNDNDETIIPPPSPALSPAFARHLLTAALTHSRAGRLAARTAAATPAWALLPLSLALLYAALQRVHTEESLLVLRGLGLQTSTTSATVLGSAATRFIPTDKIQDVLVNEAFRGFEVRYYLVVVVEGEEDVVVVFPRLLPRRRVVEQVWRGVRGCLFEERGKVWRGNGKVVGAGGGVMR